MFISQYHQDLESHTSRSILMLFRFTREDLQRCEFLKICNSKELLLCIHGYIPMFKHLHRYDGRSFILRRAQILKHECGWFQYIKFWFGINTSESMACCFKILFFYTSKIWVYLPYKKLKYYWEGQSVQSPLTLPLSPNPSWSQVPPKIL